MNAIPLNNLIVVTGRDAELNATIRERARVLGLELGAEFKAQMRLLARDVLLLTPPSSGPNVAGQKALKQGQGAINRDLFSMGFVPVTIKGFRMISHVPAGNVKGRRAVPITPVRVRTKLNPKFDDPDAFHHARIAASQKIGRRGKISRGGRQAFYVAIGKYRAMKGRLYKKIGKLAAPWLPAIRSLYDGALPGWVPAFVRRHEGDVVGRSRYAMNFDPQKGNFFIHFVNMMPGTADDEAEATQRRIEAAKGYRINAIRRGLQGRAQRIARGGH
jgi:hypothetical protein